jgi:hypothetical protein
MLMQQEPYSTSSLQPAAALMAGAPPGSRTKIIISSHNYKRTPDIDELRETVRKMVEVGADVVKIATTAADISDNTKLFKILQEAQVRSHMSFSASGFSPCARRGAASEFQGARLQTWHYVGHGTSYLISKVAFCCTWTRLLAVRSLCTVASFNRSLSTASHFPVSPIFALHRHGPGQTPLSLCIAIAA